MKNSLPHALLGDFVSYRCMGIWVEGLAEYTLDPFSGMVSRPPPPPPEVRTDPEAGAEGLYLGL